MNQVQQKTESMTGGFLKAQIIFAAVKKAFHAVVNLAKDSVKDWEAQERAVAVTTAALQSTGDACGMTVKQLIDLSDEIQKTTTVSHTNALAMEDMLLTYTHIGKETFPEATKAIVDMAARVGDLTSDARIVGRALQDPINGLTMLQRVGVQFSQVQKDQIANFVKTNQLAAAQGVILKELEIKYGGSAAAIRNTFGGAVTALNNDITDLKENLGQYIAAVGKPLVENIDHIVSSINEWLKTKDAMEGISNVFATIGAVIETIKAVVEPLVKILKDEFVSVWNTITAEFSKLVGPGNEASAVFTGLAVAGKAVGLVITVVAETIKYGIRILGDLITIIRTSADTLVRFGRVMGDMTNQKKWDEFHASVAKTGQAFTDLGGDIVSSVVEPVKTVINGVKDIYDTAAKDGKALRDNFEASLKSQRAAILSYLTAVTGDVKTAGNIVTSQDEAAAAASAALMKEWGSERKKVVVQDLQTMLDAIKAKGEAYKAAGAKADEVDKWVAAESVKAAKDTEKAWKDSFDAVASKVNNVIGVVQSSWNSITAIWTQALTNEAQANDNQYARQKANIEATVTDETEKTAQLKALDDQYAQKKHEIAVKQFQQQQAMAVANVVFSTAQAVMAGFAQFGWPLGLIPAAFAVALGAVELGVILSEEPPAYAQGGDIAAGQAGIVGDAGEPELFVPKTSGHIFTMDQAAQQFGGGGVNMQNHFYGDMNSQIDFDRTMHMIGASFRAQQRGAARNAA